jgi:hypothetical protein
MPADRTLRLDVPRQGMLLRMVGRRMPQLLTRAAADTLVVAADMPAVVADTLAAVDMAAADTSNSQLLHHI